MARLVAAGQAWLGLARRCVAWWGLAGQAGHRHVKAGTGRVRLGAVRQAWLGTAGHGQAGLGSAVSGMAWQGRHGMSTALRAHLQAIRDEHGTLTPALVVDTARDPEHPLHSRFEWDDTVAAERWRLEQAGHLLRVTYRPMPGKPRELRAFVALRGEDTPTSDYVPTEEALANPFTRELLLRSMKRDWQTFQRRYKHMSEFASFVSEQIGDVSA